MISVKGWENKNFEKNTETRKHGGFYFNYELRNNQPGQINAIALGIVATG
ncbi:hypothetical protein FACS1894181_14790 [Bacteroidia bacterium]|nr:hypothetical protein FACS1894181_14790 [Bacteroidia bacterium]